MLNCWLRIPCIPTCQVHVIQELNGFMYGNVIPQSDTKGTGDSRKSIRFSVLCI